MKRTAKTMVILGVAAAILLTLGVSGSWANDPSYGREGYGGSTHGGMGSHRMGMMHRGAGHLIRHLLKHESELGLTPDQVAKLKDIQLGLDKARIKAEAMKLGLLCYPMGGTLDGARGDHVLIAPPYIVSEAQLDELTDKLGRAVDAAFRQA